MIRNKAPNIIIAFLVLTIMFISYNHWSLSQKNLVLQESLMLKEDKMNDLMEKKSYIEKQVGINSDRIKYFEEKIQSNVQFLKQKDTEIDDLNSRLRTKVQDYDKLLADFNEVKDNLNSCRIENEKSKGSNSDIFQLKEELRSNLSNQSKCNSNDSEVFTSFKTKLVQILNTHLNESESRKIQNLILLSSENLTLVNQEQNRNLLEQVEIDICKLPKVIGDCQNSTDRYYYDFNSGNCLLFSYSGCNGSLNNFITLEECQIKCLNKTSQFESNSILNSPKNESIINVNNSSLNLNYTAAVIKTNALN